MPNDLSWRTPIPGYAWSQDYTALLDAMVGGAVMATCLYSTNRDGTNIFDACFMMRRPISYKHVEFVASARGIEYFSARDANEFIALCEKYEVKFLDPRMGNSALTISGIPAQAQGDPATTPPLRISVTRAREIMEGMKANG